MTFLVKGTLTKAEARKTLELLELVSAATSSGPVPLELYASIRRVNSDLVRSRERSARRLVKDVRAAGYEVHIEGDDDRITVDFSVDPKLVVALQALTREAEELLGLKTGVVLYVDPRSLTASYKGGTRRDFYGHCSPGQGINALAAANGMGNERVTRVLRSEGAKVRPCGRPRAGHDLSDSLRARVKAAYEAGSTLRDVARMLGCSVEAARAFLVREGVTLRPVGRPRRAP